MHQVLSKAGLPTRAMLLLVCLLVGGVSVSCRLAQKFTSGHVTSRTPDGCLECHVNTTHQWTCSAHSEAWTDAQFVRRTKDHQMEACLPCHAPEPLLEQPEGAKPKVRDWGREHGVDCHACHAVGCAYAGDFKTHGAHPVTSDEGRLSCPTLCGSCHQSELKEYNTLYVSSLSECEQPESCVGCHMPTRYERVTQDHLLSYIHPKRVVHDHSMPTWTACSIRKAIQVQEPTIDRPGHGSEAATLDPDERETWIVHFELTNRGAAHRIPTGRFGHRELKIVVELLADNGDALGRDETSLFGRDSDGLAPGDPRSFDFSLPIAMDQHPADVRLLVERINADRSFECTLVDRTWTVD